MANGWIKFEKSLERDPRVRNIATALQSVTVTLAALHTDVTVTLVLGALARLWWYGDTYIGENDIIETTVDHINEVVGIEGFAQLLPPDWLQVIDSKSIKLPQFHSHNGSQAKKRVQTAARVAKHRAKKKAQKSTKLTVVPQLTPVTQCNGVTVTHNALPDQDQDQDLLFRGSLTSSVPVIHHSETTSVGPVERVFEHWRSGYQKLRAVLDAKRRRVITAALKQFDEVTLKLSIDGYKNSAHHMGENPNATTYDDVTLFLRDATHIEAGLNFGQRGAIRPLTAVEQTRQHLQNQINGINGHGDDPHRGSEGEGSSRLVTTDRLFR